MLRIFGGTMGALFGGLLGLGLFVLVRLAAASGSGGAEVAGLPGFGVFGVMFLAVVVGNTLGALCSCVAVSAFSAARAAAPPIFFMSVALCLLAGLPVMLGSPEVSVAAASGVLVFVSLCSVMLRELGVMRGLPVVCGLRGVCGAAVVLALLAALPIPPEMLLFFGSALCWAVSGAVVELFRLVESARSSPAT